MKKAYDAFTKEYLGVVITKLKYYIKSTHSDFILVNIVHDTNNKSSRKIGWLGKEHPILYNVLKPNERYYFFNKRDIIVSNDEFELE